MNDMTNRAAVHLLKAISFDSNNSQVKWSSIADQLGITEQRLKGIRVRNGHWPTVNLDNEPYDATDQYSRLFRMWASWRTWRSSARIIIDTLRNDYANCVDRVTDEKLSRLEQLQSLDENDDELKLAVEDIIDYIALTMRGGTQKDEQATHHKRSVRKSEVSLCWWNVTSVDYPSSISSVTAVMDIVHFHGLTWTNSNREFLLNCLCVPNVAVRVALLSTESAFFRAFAEYAELDERNLVRKHDEVVNIWRMLANSANEMTGEPVNFMLYDVDYFPAKSISRFDNRVIITPNTIAKQKSQFVSFECLSNNQAKGQSAFDAAVREVDSVIRLGPRIV